MGASALSWSDSAPDVRRAAVWAQQLGKRFRKRWALRDCDVTVPRGAVCALTGPNGAGKTTLMRLVMGLVAPDSGRLLVLGAEPGLHGVSAQVAFLSQEKPLYRSFRVGEMLRAAAALNGDPRQRSGVVHDVPGNQRCGWDDRYARRLVEEAGLPIDARVGSLSGGQRTRLALALALGRRPKLLVLDEPFADLDPAARRRVMATLDVEARTHGMTILLSSHAVADLEGFCDYVILLRDGGTALSGPVGSLLDEHYVVSGSSSRELLGPVVPGTAMDLVLPGRSAGTLVRGRPPAEIREQVRVPSLEDVVVAYLDADSRARRPVESS